MRILLLALVVWSAAAVPAWSQDTPRAFEAVDSLGEVVDGQAQAGDVLATLAWEGGPFAFEVHETPRQEFDAVVTFASPKPSGDEGIDTAVLRWYRPAEAQADDGRGPDAQGPKSPAVLLVHTLHPDLPVATLLARGLKQRGVHAFVIELPGYASRVEEDRKFTGVTTLVNAAQAVGDCRRAYDVICAFDEAGLADIDNDRIAIQGTSLGSFIATSAAALDGCFNQTFLFLSGGDGVDILENGQKDAFHVRGALQHYGYSGDKLRALIDPVEPLHIAHRLDPKSTWMFNAKDDTVVPAKNAELLSQAIGLEDSHHVWLNGNHYTAFILLPGVLDRMKTEMGVDVANPAAGK
ncbi:hypothetical protein [Algisphaera agarilytica]|uniref:Acetyl esterase/lipase n=1 Tax=Algisphaera agarilytica TaxID=1385975 RepID=A0A7X0LJX2_9BACT|nr:hypothetical protein [Algisphaera agarilytica]MBB6428373.1 acetyl esterase/lipase [Algisphaera agarilytica]